MKNISKNDLKKDYLSKINLIVKYNEAYYLNSSPLVSDSEYDELKIKIRHQNLLVLNPQRILKK